MKALLGTGSLLGFASYPGLDGAPNLDPFHNGRYIRRLALRLTIFAVAWITIGALDATLGTSKTAEVIILSAAAAVLIVLAWFLPLTVMILQWGQQVGPQRRVAGQILKYVRKTVEIRAVPLDSMQLVRGAAAATSGQDQPYLQLVRGNTAAYITCASHRNGAYVSWTFLIRMSPGAWLLQILYDLRRSAVRQTLRSASTRAWIEAIHGCVLAGIDAALADTGDASRDRPPSAGPWGLGVLVQIYLGDGRQHAEVEDAVIALMSAFAIDPIHWEGPVRGSWYQRIRGQVKRSAPPLDEVLPKAVRAVEMKTLLSQQAGIDAAQGDALAKLISALAAEDTAVIQMGSMLLVKAKGIVMARNLTQLEMTQLERDPALMRDPDTIIQQLRDAGSPELVHADQLCSCGSGRTIRECACTL